MTKCYCCEEEYADGVMMKSDDFNDENLFCLTCFKYQIQCYICKKKAVSCEFLGKTHKDELVCKTWYETDYFNISYGAGMKYNKEICYRSYYTNNSINGTFIEIAECFICRRIVCPDCYIQICIASYTTIYTYHVDRDEEKIEVCDRCKRKSKITDSIENQSLILMRQLYAAEKKQYYESRKKEMWKAETVKRMFNIPASVMDEIVAYF